ncbi:hypothetical protein BT96DRAFT_944829 [Gymnopus androsaceus JB14]|uniref:Uncharacterized protein n=1 Tax=Gymnopus androsaceus JB14 TaxID=1447944 RepID=A0A6A4H4G9_9AGAR|nr:hypothetical protein BT96DRAFT_944829 [Gymnopus androsaceus JB14]
MCKTQFKGIPRKMVDQFPYFTTNIWYTQYWCCRRDSYIVKTEFPRIPTSDRYGTSRGAFRCYRSHAITTGHPSRGRLLLNTQSMAPPVGACVQFYHCRWRYVQTSLPTWSMTLTRTLSPEVVADGQGSLVEGDIVEEMKNQFYQVRSVSLPIECRRWHIALAYERRATKNEHLDFCECRTGRIDARMQAMFVLRTKDVAKWNPKTTKVPVLESG